MDPIQTQAPPIQTPEPQVPGQVPPAGPTPPPPPPAPVPVQPIQPPKTNKLLIVGVVVLVLLILGAGGLLAYQNYFVQKPQPTPSPTPIPSPTSTPDITADWKTYTDQKYHYALKYPNEWEFSVRTPETDKTLLSLEYAIFSKPNPEPQEGVHITIEPNPNKYIPTISWFEKEKLKNYPVGTKIEDLGLKESTFLGYKSLVDKNGTIIVAKDSYFYGVGYLVHPGNEEYYLEKYNQILSTFKFTDQTTDTSSWKTYSDTKYKFSFKYPPEWKAQDNNLTFPGGRLSVLVNHSGIGFGCTQQVKSENILVGGQKATETTFNGVKNETCDNTGSALIWVTFNDSSKNRFDITFGFNVPNTLDYEKTFDNILSTFKFTD